ncbi:RNA-binding cell elongation regulator Jag/EloR [Apilactobacillus ozensis]|uniref:RNA-binding cell elongation regulator Jag/EloR n=1 Tax=Apilactobacillus ozensis TaxID=866801 RepID=UPI00200B9932|nr:RNA-binding cell elongation regulator Jag/EloR [Apilactobacillus ozensis]MCK8607427.1 protein jag [Apilactobacillus ozensis]
MGKFVAKSVDQAIEKGLHSLNISKDNAEISVIQNDRKGFLGLFKKDAVVEIAVKENNFKNQVTKLEMKKSEAESDHKPKYDKKVDSYRLDKETIYQNLSKYLIDIISQLQIKAQVKNIKIAKKSVYIEFKTDTEGLLIGKHGLTINSLQELSQIYLNHQGLSYVNVVLDVANYRERRKEILKHLAIKTSREVVAKGSPVYLDAMPAFERKVIHQTLQNSKYVATQSSGQYPYRFVIVLPSDV